MTNVVLDPDDELTRELVEHAARQGRSLSATHGDLLRVALRTASEKPGPARTGGWRTFRCGKVLVDVTDRDVLGTALDEP